MSGVELGMGSLNGRCKDLGFPLKKLKVIGLSKGGFSGRRDVVVVTSGRESKDSKGFTVGAFVSCSKVMLEEGGDSLEVALDDSVGSQCNCCLLLLLLTQSRLLLLLLKLIEGQLLPEFDLIEFLHLKQSREEKIE